MNGALRFAMEDYPWLAGELVLTEGALEAVERAARRGYAAGEEACGYLVGPAVEPALCDEAVELPNLAASLHARSPRVFFRTARTFFAFSERRLEAAMRAGSAGGRPVKVLFHSHLDDSAALSPTDRATLSGGIPPACEGGRAQLGPGPRWPLVFLVTSVRAGGVDDHRLYRWHDGDFASAAWSVRAGAGAPESR